MNLSVVGEQVPVELAMATPLPFPRQSRCDLPPRKNVPPHLPWAAHLDREVPDDQAMLALANLHHDLMAWTHDGRSPGTVMMCGDECVAE